MNSQYAVAVHVLALIGFSPQDAGSSEAIAASVGTNAVVVRNVMGLLRRADLLHTRQGVAGAALARPAREITLLDVYRAVNDCQSVFRMHDRPHPNCPVGRNIQATLEGVFGDAQRAMEAQLAAVTLADIVEDLARRAS